MLKTTISNLLFFNFFYKIVLNIMKQILDKSNKHKKYCMCKLVLDSKINKNISI